MGTSKEPALLRPGAHAPICPTSFRPFNDCKSSFLILNNPNRNSLPASNPLRIENTQRQFPTPTGPSRSTGTRPPKRRIPPNHPQRLPIPTFPAIQQPVESRPVPARTSNAPQPHPGMTRTAPILPQICGQNRAVPQKIQPQVEKFDSTFGLFSKFPPSARMKSSREQPQNHPQRTAKIMWNPFRRLARPKTKPRRSPGDPVLRSPLSDDLDRSASLQLRNPLNDRVVWKFPAIRRKISK